ncbi:MAG TPA: KH domain-containing protein [Chloroflexota bacterium]|nr:KH domain-containing protein [Chloroflexota bacterium]
MQPSPQPSNSNREFIEFVARLLARNPDDVQVTETVEDNVVAYHLSLAPEDVGRVIGREGRIVRAIRSLLRSAAVRQGVRVSLEVG